MVKQIQSMQSGECRWIGREDIHVYCHAPMRHEPRYCVVCPAGDMDYGNWTTAAGAASQVDSILKRTAGQRS